MGPPMGPVSSSVIDLAFEQLCREETDKKDQGWALLDEDSTPTMPDEDNPAITDTTATTVVEGGGTYRTPSK
jgi:hypothetical protein